MFPGRLQNQFAVDRLDEAHVRHRCVKHLAGCKCRRQHLPKASGATLLPWRLISPFADRQRRRSGAGTVPVPDTTRAHLGIIVATSRSTASGGIRPRRPGSR